MSRRSRLPRATSIGGFAVVAMLAVLFVIFQGTGGDEPPVVPEETVEAGPAFEVFFTDPGGPEADTLRGGPDARLAEAMDAARFSIDIAIFDFDLWSLRDALLRAHSRGVTVRMVIDSDNALEPEIDELEAAGIPVIGDRREPLMHHKFVVIDRLDVWTGSMNFTLNGAYRNDNNLIRLRSNRLAESYTREFEEMFVDDRFGALSMADTPFPAVTINGTPVEVLFSPDDGVAARLLEALQGAESSIDFLAFAFTSDPIAEAMLERASAGVLVRGVFERSQAGGQGSEYERLRDAGLDVRRDANPRNMHHKVILIDGTTVVLGSYNFSRNAEEFNDENLVMIGSVELASLYAAEFERIYGLSQ